MMRRCDTRITPFQALDENGGFPAYRLPPRIPFGSTLLLVAITCAVCLVMLCPSSAFANPTSADKRAEAESVLSSLNAMQVTLDELSNEYGEALAAQEEAEANRDAAQARLVELSDKVSTLQDRLRAHAREMYRSGGITYLDALLKASSFKEFATNWDMLDTVNATVADMVQTKKSLAEEEKQQADIFAEQASIASEKAAEAAAAAEQAQATIADMQATYESLSEEALQLLEEERKAQEAEEAARAQEVLAAAAAAAQADAAAKGAESQPSSPSGGTESDGSNVTAGAPGANEMVGGVSDIAAPGAGDSATGETGSATDSGNAGGEAQTETTDSTVDPSATNAAPAAADAPAPAGEAAGGESGASADEGTGSSDTSADESSSAESAPTSYEGGSDTVSRARACLGAPYVWGGVGPEGYDCSGLVSYCLSGSHTRLGTTYTFMKWPRVSDPQPGDIAVNNSHTGIYIGGGQMIHAATYGVGVITGPVQSGMIFVRYGG